MIYMINDEVVSLTEYAEAVRLDMLLTGTTLTQEFTNEQGDEVKQVFTGERKDSIFQVQEIDI